MRRDDDTTPISAQEASQLFADWKAVPALTLAVSGGPDSLALMWFMARWRRRLARGPQLVAVTVDHGLRPGSAREARQVQQLARALDLEHRVVRWTGDKPQTGVQAAARVARYRLLARVARQTGSVHVLTAHTRDDQAETLVMRLLRGSGIAGLAAMAREIERDGVLLARPLLNVPKSRLIATLNKAGIAFADDPTNRDIAFTRARVRALLPALAQEGGDSRVLARLAGRFARVNAAIEVLADGAERYLALRERREASNVAQSLNGHSFDAEAFAAMPEEIRIRLLMRAIDRFGHEGPAELGKVEALAAELHQRLAKSAKAGRRTASVETRRTLAGAIVSVRLGRIRIEPAPPRRRSR